MSPFQQIILGGFVVGLFTMILFFSPFWPSKKAKKAEVVKTVAPVRMPEKGDIWSFHHVKSSHKGSPWQQDLGEMIRCEVIEVKDGWVRYGFGPSKVRLMEPSKHDSTRTLQEFLGMYSIETPVADRKLAR